jgi:uncharacterized protein (TIGR02145 family)
MYINKIYKILIITIILLVGASFAIAANIGNSSGYAWLEKLGWLKLGGGAGVDYGVTVGDAALNGYAWSEKTGWINFDDSGSYYGVLNDGAGNLSGYAWSEKTGWISFDDASVNDYYQVTLANYSDESYAQGGTVTLRTNTTVRTDTSLRPGEIVGDIALFSGYGWSEIGGYINFDDAGDVYRSQTAYTVPEASFACGDSVYNDNDSITYFTVLADDGNCWLASNLGTANIATAYNDSSAYGAYYQWGRLADGHQVSTSDTTSTNSSGDVPGHDDFITEGPYPYDWRVPQNDNLWQGVDGTNNPCPEGWRIPTQTEWATLVSDEEITNYTTAYSSSLKLTVAGRRSNSDGSLLNQGSFGFYWSSSPDSIYADYLDFSSSGVSTTGRTNRSYGVSARCLKN